MKDATCAITNIESMDNLKHVDHVEENNHYGHEFTRFHQSPGCF